MVTMVNYLERHVLEENPMMPYSRDGSCCVCNAAIWMKRRSRAHSGMFTYRSAALERRMQGVSLLERKMRYAIMLFKGAPKFSLICLE